MFISVLFCFVELWNTQLSADIMKSKSKFKSESKSISISISISKYTIGKVYGLCAFE